LYSIVILKKKQSIIENQNIKIENLSINMLIILLKKNKICNNNKKKLVYRLINRSIVIKRKRYFYNAIHYIID